MYQINKLIKLILPLAIMCCGLKISAQGPPITGDKPIMLGEGTFVIKTLTELRNTEGGDLLKMPLMVHYLPSSNTLVALHVPYVNTPQTSGLGDLSLLFKYQFYRHDKKGKTLRMVAKTYQTFPTGEFVGERDFGVDEFQSYNAIIIGYETIKHGIVGEIGYRYVGGDFDNAVVAKLGFGLPVLKPVYPANQLNFYFENQFKFFSEGRLNWMMSQGLQYAKARWTWEISYRSVIQQEQFDLFAMNHSIFFGTRFIF